MLINKHGGECCGVSHIFNFNPNYANKKLLKESIKDAVSSVQQHVDDENELYAANGEPFIRPYRGLFGHLIEVVLTDEQMINWAETLKEEGFRLHRRWLNDNSGNYCNLLSWIPKEPSKPRPYKW